MIATVILSLSLGIAFVIQTLHTYGCKWIQCTRHDSTIEEIVLNPVVPMRVATPVPVPRPTLIIPDLTNLNPYRLRNCVTKV
jgi:hypothetical protein